jgi:predicted membrane-bound spermidine synthase/Flp pilus assembly protein TadD
MLYLLFFLSGFSGLIYQVVWVRVFGNVFGNTIYSASLVVAVFLLGLGVGSYVVGAWSDRRYAVQPESLLRAYGYFELLIGALALGVSALLPHLGQVSALVSSYSREASGWYALSTASYLARAGIILVLLMPITLLMGGTLTLLIRHLVRSDAATGGWRIAVLYGVNTAGAALGCFLTDFTLVPVAGLRDTQIIAVLLNLIAAAGAFYLDRLEPAPAASLKSDTRTARNARRVRLPLVEARSRQPDRPEQRPFALAFTSLALAMSGFAAMGMEIVWFRHFTIMLGGFRAVFSLLLTIILIGIGAGSLASSFLHRRTSRPAQWLMSAQGLFVAFTLAGLAVADGRVIDQIAAADSAYQAALGPVAASAQAGLARAFTELWFNARPMLLEVGLPALLMGFSFPLANAIIQRQERSVGRTAGALYLANTVGAVCGSLAAGFLFLPVLGIQGSATVLMAASALAVIPLYFATRISAPPWPTAFAWSLLIGGGSLTLWLLLPADHVIARALPAPVEGERLLNRSEGLTEVITVVERPGYGRILFTNGHPMSSTARFSQRYMRALAHIPLLSIDNPETVLVIGFGVGNTVHAATLHPSVRRVEVADLSRDILAHADYFSDFNQHVLSDPRVVVYINDGRHHLQMQPPASYDLITLEPPPIGYAGVAALYSREFYQLARTRLKPKGYMSQWLPAYQVPAATTLAMTRAFVDVFPNSVLLSGAHADLLLIGTTDSRIEIDPARLVAALSRAPAVQADLQRLDLGSVREIVGTFIGSAERLAEATRATVAASDDRPIQEYAPRSLPNLGAAVPGAMVDLRQVAAWCPNCFIDGKPAPLAEGLDTYLGLLDLAYMASPADAFRARSLADREGRLIEGSAYLGAIVPESVDVHNYLGIALAEKGELDKAIAQFRQSLQLDPDSAVTHWHLGAALASLGASRDAIEHLRRSVELDPANAQVHTDLASLLIDARQLDGAVEQSRAALRLTPDSVKAHDSLGVALAMQGNLDEAIDHFQRALALNPDLPDTRRNLAITLQRRGQLTGRRK